MIQFYLNGKLHSEDNLPPTTSVLDYIRERVGLTGTKEGCAEGDCGTCSIVLVREEDSNPVYEVVNSCLMMMPQLDGKCVVTVEGLESEAGFLNPIQDAMVQSDGTQCGFCTPGFVMALYALRQGGEEISDGVIHTALAGNLCRCTGYRPIIEAAHEACKTHTQDAYGGLTDLDAGNHYQVDDQQFFAPESLSEIADIYATIPDAYLLAGGTDLGILTSKERQPLTKILHTSNVKELNEISETEEAIEFGAAVTYTRALPYIERLYPSFATLISRIGSRQIRNIGTLGGNVGNASPIGDTPPCLIALGATLKLYSKEGERELPIEDFFLDYRKTDLKPGEIIKSIGIPKLIENQEFRTYKISKRYDQDISSVIGAYRVEIENDKISNIRTGFGGMAATPKRALVCEKALIGEPWNEETMVSAASAVIEDFQPIDDHRASKHYRLRVAGNLFTRLYRDIANVEDVIEVMAS